MSLSVKLKKRVDGFSLDVAWEIGNELAVLFGFSGSGKSMTFQLIAGLMTPEEGVIRIGDITMFDSSAGISVPPQKRHLGYVFQDLALFPHMTVNENIAYGANGAAKDEKIERGRQMIDRFRLQGLENKFPSEISGGQKQRVAFARALIRRPPVLLLDEPFSALDSPLRLEMQGLLKEIRKELEIPIVLITHDALEACSLADSIIVYSGGRVVQAGAPVEVFSHPANSEVEGLVNTKRMFRMPSCITA